MAASGFTPIQLYYSATTTNVPLAANLAAGELAINTADGKLFYKDSSGTVQTIASTAGLSQWTTAGSNIYYTTGNVGIGNTTPSSFNASADNLVVGTTSGDNGITIVSGTANQGSLFFADGTTGGAQQAAGYMIYVHTSDYMALGTSNTERMRLDSSGNLGLGVTPSAWGGTFKSISVNTGANYSGTATSARIYANSYYNGTNYIYSTTGYANYYYCGDGEHNWYTAPSGTAGATVTFTNRMLLDASGNLGIGTTSPNAKLEIAGTSIDAQLRFTATGVANTVVGFNNSGSTNFVGAVNNTSYLGNAQAYPLVFTVNTAERMRIDSSGRIFAGTTGSVGGAAARLTLSSPNLNSSYGGIGIRNEANENSGYFVHFVNYNNAIIGSISQNATTTVAYNTSSDYRLKENIAPMVGALDKVALLKPVTYTWKDGGADGQGFIAHELAEVVPDCVTGEKDATREEEYEISPAIPAVLDEEGNEVTPAVEAVMGTRTVPVYQGIDTSFLVATLTAAIQELKAIVDTQAEQIKALQGAK